MLTGAEKTRQTIIGSQKGKRGADPIESYKPMKRFGVLLLRLSEGLKEEKSDTIYINISTQKTCSCLMLYSIPLDKYIAILFNQDATDRDLGCFQYFATKQTSMNDSTLAQVYLWY